MACLGVAPQKWYGWEESHNMGYLGGGAIASAFAQSVETENWVDATSRCGSRKRNKRNRLGGFEGEVPEDK